MSWHPERGPALHRHRITRRRLGQIAQDLSLQELLKGSQHHGPVLLGMHARLLLELLSWDSETRVLVPWLDNSIVTVW